MNTTGTAALKLRLACWHYDRTRGLTDGSVHAEGIELAYQSDVLVADIFKRMIKDREFDVSELGFTFYLRTLETDDPPFIAIPVFPNRFFRHAAIFINTASGIRKPTDLAGKKVGELMTYGHDAGVWAKGILAEEYGVPIDTFSYVIGGVGSPMPKRDWLPAPRPPQMSFTDVVDQELGALLERGEIDALFSAIVPSGIRERSPKVARLFENSDEVERDYFRRTGIFPIMHTVVIRRDLHRKHPGLAQSVYQAFCDAKQQAQRQYEAGRQFHQAPMMVPWFDKLYEENRDLMGADWWPYGLKANHKAVDTFLRYHHEQGLSKRRLTPEEIFVPELLST